MDEIEALRTKLLTLYHKENSENIPRILKETKLKLREKLEKKQVRRKRYEEINNKIKNLKTYWLRKF